MSAQEPITPANHSPKNKRLLGAGMLAAGLAAGAIFAPIGFAGAQEDGDDVTETDGSVGERRPHTEHRGEILESLGIDADAVRAGFEADQTLAEIAEANGVSEADLIAAIQADVEAHVAEAVESGRITQEQADEKLADLADTVSERVNTPPSERPERGPRGEGGPRGDRLGRGEVLDELGLTIDDVQAGREAGQTLAETAEANGVSESDLVDALVARATERVEAAVEAGRIDADEATEKLDGIEERIAERVNAVPGDRPERGLRGPRGDVEESSAGF